MKIALYFGSFNPVHTGHLIVANFVANNTTVDQVWFVISPQNPFKQSAHLLNEYHRLHLVRLAIEGEPKLLASDAEFKLPKPSYTIDTLTYLTEKYPQHTFSILLGSDSFQNLPKWKNAEMLIEKCEFIVYQRATYTAGMIENARFQLLDAPFLQISASYIREQIKAGKSIRYLVPDVVKEEIERNGYYRT